MAGLNGKIQIQISKYGIRQLEIIAEAAKSAVEQLKDLEDNHCHDCGKRLETDPTAPTDCPCEVRRCPECGERYIKREESDQ
jgi:NAD-dependent SIR2 family protein deacetylase